MDMGCCIRMQEMAMIMKKAITVLQICSGTKKTKRLAGRVLEMCSIDWEN